MMKACFKAVILSIETHENILNFNFLMGVLDISTVYASFLKQSFIDVKNNEVSLIL